MDYDIAIIRPELRNEDIKFRAAEIPPPRLKAIRKGLLTLHTLELMAVSIYRYQITRKANELNRQLVAAMCNEMTHCQDFQVKLLEFGSKPSKLRWIYWIVGFALGSISKLMGSKAILKTGIWVETKAVDHYDKLLSSVDWDSGTRKVIEKNQADEYGHIDRWQKLISNHGC